MAWAPPTPITAGTALSAIQLSAKASVPGSFTYSPPLGTVLLTGTRPLRAAFVPSDAVDYMPVTANSAIEVEAEPSKIAPKITWNTPSAVLYGTALSRTQFDATANAPGTFAYAPAAGTVLKAGTQLLSASFTPTNTVAFSKTNASVLITVTKAIPVVTWALLRNITQGTPLGVAQLNALANVKGTFSYSPGPGSVLPVGARRLAATFSPSDAVDYSPVTVNNALTVVSASEAATTPAITWPVPSVITYGTALGNTQLDAMANTSGSFAYTPSAGTVLKTGRQALNAVFTPSDTKTYSAATASVQLTVNPSAPIITWGAPNPITAGTALSATQLSARASVPGGFTYSPSAGAVLAAGTHQLTVAFSPADASDYSGASAYTSLVVNASSSGSGGGPANPAPTGCGSPTINLNSGMSQSALQSTISGAPNCALIVFAAGTYNISGALKIPCNSLTITGPAATPATAEITTSNGSTLFQLVGGCASGTTTIEYLHLDHGPALNVDGNSYTNIVFEHNQLTSLPGNTSTALGGMTFQQGNGNTINGVTIEYNTWGDANSCTVSENTDIDGCGIEVFAENNNASNMVNFVVKYNTFIHLNEAIKFYGTSYLSGRTANTCDGCDIEFNYFTQIHRMSIEFQEQTVNHPLINSNNVFSQPLNGYYETYAVSMPCCQYGHTFGSSTINPAALFENNIQYSTISPGFEWGVEAWGLGTLYKSNLIQGQLCLGFEPGNNSSMSISNNIMQGPIMAGHSSCPNYHYPGSFIGNPPENGGAAPTTIGNIQGDTPTAITSVAPTMSPASGGQTFPLTITLTDAGYTSGAQPLGNTGIWYTTDGSTSVPGSGTAQYLGSGGTFVLPAPATVKAVGMWGTPNQPTSYPAGYGFVPSGVVTAAYSVSGGIKRPAGTASSSNSPTGKLAAAVAAAAELPAGAASAALESVAINPSQPVVAIGSTTQLKAIATFDDGSVKDVTADFGWQSSDGRIMTANGSGTLAGVASGKATISGSYRGLQASVSANSTIGEVVWSDPIVITEGRHLLRELAEHRCQNPSGHSGDNGACHH